jgi:hypothetical protein
VKGALSTFGLVWDNYSPIYDGIVLRRAFQIVQWRLRLRGVEMARLMHVSKSSAARWVSGQPVMRHIRFERGMESLASLLLESGNASRS